MPPPAGFVIPQLDPPPPAPTGGRPELDSPRGIAARERLPSCWSAPPPPESPRQLAAAARLPSGTTLARTELAPRSPAARSSRRISFASREEVSPRGAAARAGLPCGLSEGSALSRRASTDAAGGVAVVSVRGLAAGAVLPFDATTASCGPTPSVGRSVRGAAAGVRLPSWSEGLGRSCLSFGEDTARPPAPPLQQQQQQQLMHEADAELIEAAACAHVLPEQPARGFDTATGPDWESDAVRRTMPAMPSGLVRFDSPASSALPADELALLNWARLAGIPAAALERQRSDRSLAAAAALPFTAENSRCSLVPEAPSAGDRSTAAAFRMVRTLSAGGPTGAAPALRVGRTLSGGPAPAPAPAAPRPPADSWEALHVQLSAAQAAVQQVGGTSPPPPPPAASLHSARHTSFQPADRLAVSGGPEAAPIADQAAPACPQRASFHPVAVGAELPEEAPTAAAAHARRASVHPTAEPSAATARRASFHPSAEAPAPDADLAPEEAAPRRPSRRCVDIGALYGDADPRRQSAPSAGAQWDDVHCAPPPPDAPEQGPAQRDAAVQADQHRGASLLTPPPPPPPSCAPQPHWQLLPQQQQQRQPLSGSAGGAVAFFPAVDLLAAAPPMQPLHIPPAPATPRRAASRSSAPPAEAHPRLSQFLDSLCRYIACGGDPPELPAAAPPPCPAPAARGGGPRSSRFARGLVLPGHDAGRGADTDAYTDLALRVLTQTA